MYIADPILQLVLVLGAASLRENHGGVSWVVSPGVAAFIGFAAQAKLAPDHPLSLLVLIQG